MRRTRHNRLRRDDPREGFTLVELLIVMGIIVFLASVVVGVGMSFAKTAQKAAAKATIAKLGAALEAFKADEGDYPQTQSADAIRVVYFTLKEDGQLAASDVRSRFIELDVLKADLGVTAYDGGKSPIELTVNASPPPADGAWSAHYVVFREGAAAGIVRPLLTNVGSTLHLGGDAFAAGVAPAAGDKVDIVAKIVMDPWERRLKYRYPRSKDDGQFDLWSMGPDGKDAGDANDPADLNNAANLDNLVYGELENQ